MVKIINNKKAIKAIKHIEENNIPCLLLWETGTGKTTLVKSLADKAKKKLTRINLNWQTGREELLWKYVLIWGETVWQDWPLTIALKEWHWLLLDEINAALPEVLFTIQALAESYDGKLWDLLIAEHDAEIITPHKDCRLFATANPADRYVGTKSFNPATLSRFMVVYIDPLSIWDELKVLESRYKDLKDKDKSMLMIIAEELRKKDEDNEPIFEYFCSTRDILNTWALINSWLPIADAAYVWILNKVQSQFEKNKIKKLIDDTLKIKDAKEIYTSFVGAKDIIAKFEKDLKESLWQIDWYVKAIEAKDEAIKILNNKLADTKSSVKKAKKILDTFNSAASLFDKIDKDGTPSSSE